MVTFPASSAPLRCEARPPTVAPGPRGPQGIPVEVALKSRGYSKYAMDIVIPKKMT